MEYTITAEVELMQTAEAELYPQPPLAMAYVPMQQWSCIYEDVEQAFSRGTLFPCLDKPFLEGMCPHV